MPNPIADNLLDQAREHLAKSDFANAAKSARAALALDSENSDASDILKAAEAAVEADSSIDESVAKTDLKLDLTRLKDEQLERQSEFTGSPTEPQSKSAKSSYSIPPYLWVMIVLMALIAGWCGYMGY